MSSDFEGYEQDFAVLTAEITNKIARVPRLPPGESPTLAGRGWLGRRNAVRTSVVAEVRGWNEVVLGSSPGDGGKEPESVEGKGTDSPSWVVGCREQSSAGLQSGLRHLVTCIILGNVSLNLSLLLFVGFLFFVLSNAEM